MVAFHFQFANQAGWECDTCRKNGLEQRRRCGFMAHLEPTERVVWARKGAAAQTCPKSYITAESLAWVERFVMWKKLGYMESNEPDARDAEAFLILEREWAAERLDHRGTGRGDERNG